MGALLGRSKLDVARDMLVTAHIDVLRAEHAYAYPADQGRTGTTPWERCARAGTAKAAAENAVMRECFADVAGDSDEARVRALLEIDEARTAAKAAFAREFPSYVAPLENYTIWLDKKYGILVGHEMARSAEEAIVQHCDRHVFNRHFFATLTY